MRSENIIIRLGMAIDAAGLDGAAILNGSDDEVRSAADLLRKQNGNLAFALEAFLMGRIAMRHDMNHDHFVESAHLVLDMG